MTVNLLDVGLVLFAVLGASAGYRLGFVARGAAWIGLLGGLAVGAWAMPTVLGLFDGSTAFTRLAVGVVAMLVAVSIGASLGEAVGLRVRRSLHGTGLRPFDQALGGIAGVAMIAVLVWFLAPAAAEIPGGVARQVRSSQVVAAVRAIGPEPPDTVRALRSLIGQTRFPEVFADLRPAPDTGPPPSQIPVPADVLARVTASTVNVESDGCGGRFEGSGWTVAEDTVVTNAHVVAGVEELRVRRPDGELLAGRVVAFDDDRDLALLEVPGLGQQPLPLARAEVGTDGATVGYPGGQDEPRPQPASVRDRRPTVGRDIYGRDTVERQVLFLSANLARGDSGSPLVDRQGRVVGTVFAVSPDQPSTAFALDVNEVQAVLDGPRGQGAGPCT